MLINKNQKESRFDYFCRWLLAILLFYIPVHRYIATLLVQKMDKGLENPVYLVLIFFHELVCIFLFPVAVYKLFKKRNVQIELLFLGILIAIFTGVLSGFINGNGVIRTLGGTYIYIKSFLFILIYAAFFSDVSEVKKVYYSLRAFALIIAGIAILQECLYFFFHYILKIDFSWKLFPFRIKSFRFGLGQVSSIMKHPNLMGLFLLLFIIMDLFLREKGYIKRFIIYTGGILFSLGRMVWTAFLFIIFAAIRSNKIRFLCVGIICCLLLIAAKYKLYFKTDDMGYFLKIAKNKVIPSSMIEHNLRVYGRESSISIFFDHPIMGAGPGTFGSAFSFILPSPLYKEYNFHRDWFRFMKKFRSLDQFWFQCLAELGLLGIFSMLSLLILCFYILLFMQKQSIDTWIRNWLLGCSIGVLVILIYTTGSGINMTEYIVLWAAFSGMGMGIMETKNV